MIQIERHVKKRELAEKLGISTSTVDRLRKNDPDFPKGKKITTGTVLFSITDINNYLNSRN